LRAQSVAFARLPHSAYLPNQRPQDQRRFHSLAFQSEQYPERPGGVAGGGGLSKLKDVVTCTVPDRPQHQVDTDGRAVCQQAELLQFLLRGQQVPFDAIDDQLRSLVVDLQVQHFCPGAQPRRQCRQFDRLNRHPCPVLFDRLYPGRIARLPVEFIGNDQVDQIECLLSRKLGKQGRTLVGFAARHPQFKQAPLREQ